MLQFFANADIRYQYRVVSDPRLEVPVGVHIEPYQPEAPETEALKFINLDWAGILDIWDNDQWGRQMLHSDYEFLIYLSNGKFKTQLNSWDFDALLAGFNTKLFIKHLKIIPDINGYRLEEDPEGEYGFSAIMDLEKRYGNVWVLVPTQHGHIRLEVEYILDVLGNQLDF